MNHCSEAHAWDYSDLKKLRTSCFSRAFNPLNPLVCIVARLGADKHPRLCGRRPWRGSSPPAPREKHRDFPTRTAGSPDVILKAIHNRREQRFELHPGSQNGVLNRHGWSRALSRARLRRQNAAGGWNSIRRRGGLLGGNTIGALVIIALE